MAKVEVTKLNGDVKRVAFWCPGCGSLHHLPIEGPKAWGFNGNIEAPTLTPSILQWWDEFQGDGKPQKRHACHSYVTDGNIKFLNDSTHNKVNQTVPLDEIPECGLMNDNGTFKWSPHHED